MTYLVKNVPSGPQLHALIIGVNDYKYLEIGSTNEMGPAQGIGLSSLTSPVVSAKAFSEWLTKTSNPAVPIGTVRLLVSGAEVSPDTDNIVDAIEEWSSLCDSDFENIAVFYFCGHGVMKTDMLILPEDFSKRPKNPFDNSINFTATLNAMESCKANTQLFLIDACRQLPYFLLTSGSDPSRKPLSYDVENQNPSSSRSAVTIYSAEKGGQASATKNQISHFTQLVLDSLEGAGSEWSVDGWQVTPQRLAQNIGAVSRRRLDNAGVEWRPTFNIIGEDSESRALHKLDAAPHVPVFITCKPKDATSEAELAICNVLTRQTKISPDSYKNDAWCAKLEAMQNYEVDAVFPAGKYTAKTTSIVNPMPPVWSAEIKVES